MKINFEELYQQVGIAGADISSDAAEKQTTLKAASQLIDFISVAKRDGVGMYELIETALVVLRAQPSLDVAPIFGAQTIINYSDGTSEEIPESKLTDFDFNYSTLLPRQLEKGETLQSADESAIIDDISEVTGFAAVTETEFPIGDGEQISGETTDGEKLPPVTVVAQPKREKKRKNVNKT